MTAQNFEQNRSQFLEKLAKKMGRPLQTVPAAFDNPVNNHPQTRLTDRTPERLVEEFMETAKTMLVDVNVASEAEAAAKMVELCEKYGGGAIVLNKDERLEALGITQAVTAKFDSHVWSPETAEENLAKSEKANIGIVFAEYGLTETGGIALFSDKDRGRSVSLLPEKSIVVVRKSTVLPRVAQLATVLHQKAQAGERMPSCVNIISGPSATADIELIKVVGVHGPVQKIYLVIDDLA
ncbi:lactate utilization protein B/C [Pasteurellaceae bacterium RH1A]|nr:lactate utilization protein B/C [Pasteurellaceae bacterium RH1A]